MRYDMAFDGGGSKLCGILFDEDCRVLSIGRSGGINSNVYPPAQVEAHIREVISQLLEHTDVTVSAINTLYLSQHADYLRLVRERLPCERAVLCSEGSLGVLSCGLLDGVCTLSGTGSDVFYVRDGRCLDTLGGWGYLLGDGGSGMDIGRQAVCATLRVWEGLEPPSLLHELLRTRCGFSDRDVLYRTVYGQSSPAQYLASICPLVAEAARNGDETARAILHDAGAKLGNECLRMLHKHQLTTIPLCTTGSVLLHCAETRASFVQTVQQSVPDAIFYDPLFQPVIGALLFSRLERTGYFTPELLEMLRHNVPELALTSSSRIGVLR